MYQIHLCGFTHLSFVYSFAHSYLYKKPLLSASVLGTLLGAGDIEMNNT